MTPAQSAQKAESKHDAKPALMLLGLDEKGRPHAARFDASLAGAAASAAKLMGFSAATVTAGGLADLAQHLPFGKVFEGSGKAFVPYVRAELFEKLVKASGVKVRQPLRLVKDENKPEAKPADASSTAKASTHHKPTDWASIKVGSEVLAVADDPTEGWFEAVVTETKPNDRFTLIWRDYKDLPAIIRHRSQLALMWAGPAKA